MSVIPDYTKSWTGDDIGGLLRILPRDIEGFRFHFNYGSTFYDKVKPISDVLPSWRVNTNKQGVCQQMQHGPLTDSDIDGLVKIFNSTGVDDMYIHYKTGSVNIDVGRRKITLYGKITKPTYKKCSNAIPNIVEYSIEPS
jgi:hypothetical protein